MSLGADLAPFSTVRALRNGSPRRIDPVVAQHGTEGQGDKPVGAACGANDQAAHGATRMNLSSVREGTVGLDLAIARRPRAGSLGRPPYHIGLRVLAIWLDSGMMRLYGFLDSWLRGGDFPPRRP
jgi:hypothetical protein